MGGESHTLPCFHVSFAITTMSSLLLAGKPVSSKISSNKHYASQTYKKRKQFSVNM